MKALSGLVAVHIEDSSEIQVIIGDYLSKVCGMDIFPASNGMTGLNIVAKIVPHLVLLDAMLPDLNGVEVCKRLRATPHGADIPIIMLSIEGSPGFIDAAYEAGVTSYINKSAPLKVLEEAILNIFRDRPVTAVPVVEEESTKPEGESVRSAIAQLYQKRPEVILPVLATKPVSEWSKIITSILKINSAPQQGYAVIALAAWQKMPGAPFNATPGQKFFWEYVRHSLASSTADDAGEHWSKLALVAYALMFPVNKIGRALQKICINHENSECRQWALRILIENKESQAPELAAQALRDRNDEVRATAALALATLGTVQHVPLLTQALNDVVAGVREQAAIALGRIGGEIGAMALEMALLEGTAEAAESAANGLALVGSSDAVEALVRAAEQRSEPAVLIQIVHALGKTKSNKSRVALWKLGKHENETVRKAARLYVGTG